MPEKSNESQSQATASVPDNPAQSKESIPCVAKPDAAGNWECTQCGLYGPWDGVICMNCGTRSETKS